MAMPKSIFLIYDLYHFLELSYIPILLAWCASIGRYTFFSYFTNVAKFLGLEYQIQHVEV